MFLNCSNTDDSKRYLISTVLADSKTNSFVPYKWKLHASYQQLLLSFISLSEKSLRLAGDFHHDRNHESFIFH